jgi:hypothetical protein
MGHREVFFGLCREAAILQNSSYILNSVGEQTVFLAVPVWFAMRRHHRAIFLSF